MTTEKQAEQLVILMEECSEVQQACAKIFRFGLHDGENLQRLKEEIGDLLGIIEWVAREHSFDADELVELGKKKQEKMLKWTSHQV